MKTKTEDFKLDFFMRNTHTLISQFDADMPYFVHTNVSVSDIYKLVNEDDVESYMNSSPDFYLDYLVSEFPDLVEFILPEEKNGEFSNIVGEIENDVQPLDITPLLRVLRCWGKHTLDNLCELLCSGVLTVSHDPDKMTFDLKKILH
jgi:hypothetical protein